MPKGEDLLIVIKDNGIGIEESMRIYSDAGRVNSSLGSKIVQERIDLLNQLGHNINLNITNNSPSGTCVTLTISEE